MSGEENSNDFQYKEFPANAEPIIATITDLYKKVEEEQEESYENVNIRLPELIPSPSSTSNSDSGIGFKDNHLVQNHGNLGAGAQVGDGDGVADGAGVQGAVGGEDPAAANDSFNTERLDSQNSADNLRQSMQRYLANKHQHLKRASEQLVTNRSVKSLQIDFRTRIFIVFFCEIRRKAINNCQVAKLPNI